MLDVIDELNSKIETLDIEATYGEGFINHQLRKRMKEESAYLRTIRAKIKKERKENHGKA